MYNFRTINIELKNLEGLKAVAEAYQEIAGMYIQRNRAVILESRDFYNGLSEVFNDIASAYKDLNEILPYTKTKRLQKKAVVLMSANTGLYGEIVEKVFMKFEADMMREKFNRQLIVIGKYGKALIENSRLNEPYIYFDFPDVKLNSFELKPIIELLTSYEQVSIYYGNYQNLLEQEPAVKNVRETTLKASDLSDKTTSQKRKRYLFEPSLETLYNFFEAEIFSLIIEQLSYEFTLSKLSSRTILLDSVIGNVEKKMKQVLFVRQRAAHDSANKKQVDSIPGILQAINVSY